MGRVVAVCIASKLHGVSYYEELARKFRDYLGMFKDVTVVPNIVTTPEDARIVAHEFKGYYPLVIFLTGGTSRLARTLIHYLEEDSAVFIAHGEHNSIPSAISARARLEIEGIPTWVFTCSEVGSSACGDVVREAINIARAAASVRGSRICLVGVEDEPAEAESFRRAFKAEVNLISVSDFESLITSRRSSKEVDEFLNKLSAMVGDDLSLRKDVLKEVGAIYASLKYLLTDLGYDAVAIDCFPYLMRHGVTPCLALALLNGDGHLVACEADLTATFLMLISKHLTGDSGWIANPSSFKDFRIYLAHCTAPINILANPKIITHFESGYPYGITGQLRYDDVTITSVDYEFTTIAATRAKILKSGLLSNNMCRTQAEILLNFPANIMPQIALANHHVVMKGDLRKHLRMLAHVLGLSYVDYEELAREIL